MKASRSGNLHVDDIAREQERLSDDERAELAALREAVRRFAQVRKYVVPVRKDGIAIGICGDLHIGSVHARQDAFAAFARECERAKVSRVIVAGDILDGVHVYKGHEYEVSEHGLHKQMIALNHLPRLKCPVDFICGNHDLSFFKRSGAAVGDYIASATGWTWRGDEHAHMTLAMRGGNMDIAISHPGSTGSAYALSYRPQKIVESISGGQKPHMLVIGHYHKAEFLPTYRNIAVVQAGCFQSQTKYMESKGIAAHLGGWIVEIALGDHANRIRAEFIPFYE